jgi:hypothetical protein
MAPTRREVEEQIAALVALGDPLADAEAAVRDALTLTPDGGLSGDVDPEALAALGEVTTDDVREARLDWYADPAVEGEYKRLLDAREAAP